MHTKRVDESNTCRKRGFTLIELLVVLAIFLTITALWFSQPNTNRELVVRNAALEMEVNMRQAQAAALGTRTVDGEFEGIIGLTYIAGISGEQNGSYVVFADNPDGVDHQYVLSTTGPNPDIVLATHDLPEFVEIYRIRKSGGGTGPSELLPEGEDHGVTILFKRPSTDALVIYEKRTEPDAGVYAWDGVAIVLSNTRYEDIKYTVRVLDTGVIETIQGDTL